MHQDSEPNPYLPSPSGHPVNISPYSTLQRIALVMGAIWLLGNGLLMLLAFSHNGRNYLLNAWHTNFHAAMLTKDTITCIVAMLGGTLLLLRHRIGWYLAMFFMCWYLAWNVILIAMAELLNWTLPVRHGEIAGAMIRSTLIAAIGLAVLAWLPPANILKKHPRPRLLSTGLILATAVASALVINSWSGIR